jgi:CBS domain-containing protein
MKPVTGATPLIAIDAIAVDTETTGLDASKARIVQVGAVGIAGGRVSPDAVLDRLVNPGEPIPPVVSKIHGIDDAMVAGAPGFPAVWAELGDFTAGRILLGHSIGFDLAVLERECRRAKLPWEKPRSLCVRLLGTVAKPDLPDHSLETLASWLGVHIEGRHSALGDARAAADIFLALLPKLHERGIRTLAEAERALLGLSGELESGHRAGWAEPVSAPGAPAFRSVDPYAYRHRVGDLMSSPPIVVKSDLPARRAIALMVERKISSLFVSDRGVPARTMSEYGIITERDVMRRLANDGEAALAHAVGSFASRPVASIRAAAFSYRAISRMDRLKIRHLAVRDDDGALAGVVSARDLLKLRARSAINLDDTIEEARSAADMAAAWSTLPGVARSLLAEEVDARTVAEIISEELCAVTRRAAVLAEGEMEAEGRGKPPSAYAVLVLGSGGRGESLLAADQDNAIVFAEGEAGGEVDLWFAALGEKLATILDGSGVPYCKGGVMAKNAAFRGSLELWTSRIEDWVRRSRPEDLLNVDIAYDMRPVHGDLALGRRLFEQAYERAQAAPDFAKQLGARVSSGNPLTLFGGFNLDKGRFDLKMYGLFPIVATARTLAIRHGIRKRSTLERLQGLIALDIGGDADMTAMVKAHELLFGLLLNQQSRDLYEGTPVSNRIEIAAVSREQRGELKSVLKRLQSAPALVQDLMFG